MDGRNNLSGDGSVGAVGLVKEKRWGLWYCIERGNGNGAIYRFSYEGMCIDS